MPVGSPDSKEKYLGKGIGADSKGKYSKFIGEVSAILRFLGYHLEAQNSGKREGAGASCTLIHVKKGPRIQPVKTCC